MKKPSKRVERIIAAMDGAGVLAYCSECRGQDESHQIGDTGYCVRHGLLDKREAIALAREAIEDEE